MDTFHLWQTLHDEGKPHPALTQMGLAMRHTETSELKEDVNDRRGWLGPKGVSFCTIQRPKQIIELT